MIWERTKAPEVCGRCRAPIALGELALMVTEARLRRCVACAKAFFGAYPPDIEPSRVEVPTFTPLPFTAIGSTVRDWKVAQSRDGE
jgi:hypothetical protein